MMSFDKFWLNFREQFMDDPSINITQLQDICRSVWIDASPTEKVAADAGAREVIEPLKEPVSIRKALLAGRESRVELSGGTGPKCAVFLVNIQLTGWSEDQARAEGFAKGFNQAAEWMQSAMSDRAAPPAPSAPSAPSAPAVDALTTGAPAIEPQSEAGTVQPIGYGKKTQLDAIGQNGSALLYSVACPEEDWDVPVYSAPSPKAPAPSVEPVDQGIEDESKGAWAAFNKHAWSEFSNREDNWAIWRDAWEVARAPSVEQPLSDEQRTALTYVIAMTKAVPGWDGNAVETLLPLLADRGSEGGK
jgi:hypothetical protein